MTLPREIKSLRAEVLTIGSELLMGHLVDTNAAYLAGTLTDAGLAVGRIGSVGDDPAAVAGAMREALRRAPVVVVSGGLGPTGDDVTRPAAFRVMGARPVLRRDVLREIERRFRARGMTMSPNNAAQALVPRGARLLRNPHGTAPGLILFRRGRAMVLLPGVPGELKPMMEGQVLPWLRRRGGRRARLTHTLKVFGLPESAVDERLADLYGPGHPVLALLASHREVKVRLTADAASPAAARRLLQPAVRTVRTRLRPWIFTERDEEGLEDVVGRLLRRRGWRLAVAESCTGGLIGHRLTNVPGSSAYFDRGVVTYSNASKTALLGVSRGLLARHGAVSPEVAAAMARGIRRRARADLGLAVTGIAGPGGARPGKPVGLVYLALADAHGVRVRELRAPGARTLVKERASGAALEMVRRRLLKGEGG